MGLGTKVRLSRLFSHPSGRLFGGAVDHFVGYGNVRQGGLKDLPEALARVMAAEPDYVTIQPGAAKHLWRAICRSGGAGHSGGLLYRRRPHQPVDRHARRCRALRGRCLGRGYSSARQYRRRLHPLADRYGQRRRPLRNAGRWRMSIHAISAMAARSSSRRTRSPMPCGSGLEAGVDVIKVGLHRRLRFVPGDRRPARCRS